MEKWAKKLNAQKEHLKEEVKAPVAEPIIDIESVSLPSSAAADAGFSILEKVNFSCIKCSSCMSKYMLGKKLFTYVTFCYLSLVCRKCPVLEINHNTLAPEYSGKTTLRVQ